MRFDVGSRKRSRIDALVEYNQVFISRPYKIPSLIGHAQYRELIKPENKKVRSQSLIQQAKHPELESSKEENEQSVGRSS
ncbi:hypothetical protein MKX03_024550 [Papaver bracteatum]|nr:hypothetical protein MKX03_024550 [Papaver bracteatum]